MPEPGPERFLADDGGISDETLRGFARELRRARRAVWGGTFSAAGEGGASLLPDPPQRAFWARITAQNAGDTTLYSIAEVVRDPAFPTTFVQPPGGLVLADAAREASGSTTVPLSSVVWLVPSPGGHGSLYDFAFTAGGGGSGTVTSVALTVPTDILSVTGSPVTTAGTLAVSKAVQSANRAFMGPTSGAAAAPAFRVINANDLPTIGARVSGAAAVIANGVNTTLTFGVEDFDSNNFHSTVSNTGNLVVPAGMGGTYCVGACVQWQDAGVGAGARVLRIQGGGSTIVSSQLTGPAVAGVGTEQAVTTIYNVVAGTIFQVVVLQTSGGNLTIAQTASYSPVFWIFKVGN
jgi:hypothetical protein